jgi:hypothetical protein
LVYIPKLTFGFHTHSRNNTLRIPVRLLRRGFAGRKAGNDIIMYQKTTHGAVFISKLDTRNSQLLLSHLPGLNWGPIAYEAIALPTELRWRLMRIKNYELRIKNTLASQAPLS